MPKGVEHLIVRPSQLRQQIGVESLMPKGVEHDLNFYRSIRPFWCRISDAERR